MHICDPPTVHEITLRLGAHITIVKSFRYSPTPYQQNHCQPVFTAHRPIICVQVFFASKLFMWRLAPAVMRCASSSLCAPSPLLPPTLTSRRCRSVLLAFLCCGLRLHSLAAAVLPPHLSLPLASRLRRSLACSCTLYYFTFSLRRIFSNFFGAHFFRLIFSFICCCCNCFFFVKQLSFSLAAVLLCPDTSALLAFASLFGYVCLFVCVFLCICVSVWLCVFLLLFVYDFSSFYLCTHSLFFNYILTV